MNGWRNRPGVMAAVLLLAAAPLPAQQPQTFRLDTGLNVLLLESHERPLIRMELLCRWDRSELPPGKEGLGGFLAQVMAAGGAGANTRNQFLRALDAQGMSFAFQPRIGSYRWTLSTDSRAQEAAMEYLADAVVRPVFDGPLVEVERQAARKRAAAAPPRERAAARFLWNLQDPAVLVPPSPEPLEHLEYQDLLDFQRRVIRPENAVLAFYGDLNLAQARQLALMHLGIWGPAPQPPLMGIGPKAQEPAAAPSRMLAVLDQDPGTELWTGALRPEGATSPAVEALLPILLARASRAQFGARITSFQLGPGAPLVIKARASRAEREGLVQGVAAALEALRTKGFTADDLGCALIQWKAEKQALPLHPEALLRGQAGGRLDPDLARAVEQVTLREIDAALEAWLQPRNLRFLLLGADAPMVQAAEKAGLGPGALFTPDS